MAKNQLPKPHYHLPETAHQQLCHARDEIRLLADLTARVGDEGPPIQLSPHALTRCFDRLADELSEVLLESSLPTGHG